jgi:RsiW-degrading membrane proteinase PrsW (M82 family)
MLSVGAVVWIIAAVVTEVTDDNILVPTVIIVGSFMVPATVAAFALSRERDGYLTTEEVLLGFLAAGTLGVVATALLEVYLLPAAKGTFIAVGFIEELGKGAVLLAVAHQVRHREPRDGMVLGAVVGAGFAAFESSGYALQAMLDHLDERPLINILETEAFRAVLAPFGHITWTALLGGALFASSHAGRFRVTKRLVGTFIGVVALHAIWDQAYGWAVMLTKGVTGVGWAFVWPNEEHWALAPSAEQVIWFNVFYDGILAVLGLIGLIWVLHEWHVYRRWRVA